MTASKFVATAAEITARVTNLTVGKTGCLTPSSPSRFAKIFHQNPAQLPSFR
jgi:hypothetical protein